MRFPEFTEEWEKSLVKEVCDIATGKSNTQDQAPNGEYPFFIRSDKSVRSNKYLYDCEAVITIGEGNIGKVFHYINGKFDLHQRCYKMTNFDGIKGKYFYHYFSANFYRRAMQLSAKATVDSVRLEMISDMKISIPSEYEQYKIIDFLDLVDQRIETQNKIIQHLESLIKGIVVTHFNQCRNKQVITISDLGTVYSVGNLSKEDLSEDGEPCILYGELFTTYGCVAHNIISRTNKYEQATLSQINDLLFPASTTVDAVSLIAPTSIQTHGVYVAGDMFGIHIQPQYDSQYISYLLNFVYNRKLAKYAQGSTIIHLHYSDIKRARILVPLLDEQKKCNQLLATLQKKLAAESLVLQMYQSQKRYLLQQMFI